MKNLLDTFPNTLSADFVPGLLHELLPDPLTLTTEGELRAYLREKGRLEDLIKANPLKFFTANPGGQADFLHCEDSTIQGFYLFAGNKTGKTTAAIVKCIERACGKPLWGLPERSGLRWKTPTVGALFCEDFDTHRTDLLPRFFTWCPRSELASDPLEQANGEPARILFKNGSIVYLRTYQQGYEKHEGKDYDWVLCNEPVGRDIYTAIWRGFTATNGVMFIAATLLSQVWLYDEMQHPFIRVFNADIFQNPHLSQQAVQNFTASLSEDEKQIRLYGRPSNLSGIVHKSFKNAFPFVVDSFDPVPWDVVKDKPWPIIMGVDPHERKPLHAAWAYVSPRNEIIWFDYALVPSGSLTETFRILDEKERSHHHACALVVMDPNRGKAIQLGGSCWQAEFEAHDYPVMLGIDDTRFGRAQLDEMLMLPEPRMRWTVRCRGKDGPLWQMERFVWEDWVGGRFERDKKEKPKDINKDFPDIHRYIAAARLDHKLLAGENSGILTLHGRTSQQNPYLGHGTGGASIFTRRTAA